MKDSMNRTSAGHASIQSYGFLFACRGLKISYFLLFHNKAWLLYKSITCINVKCYTFLYNT